MGKDNKISIFGNIQFADSLLLFFHNTYVSLDLIKNNIMHRYQISFFLLILICFPDLLFAQISDGGTPPSFNLKTQKSASSPDFILPRIKNIDALYAEDKLNPIPFRYSIVEEVNIDIKKEGKQITTESGDNIWQYYISSVESFSLGIIFKNYKLPEGAKLFIYSPDKENILGAFTNKNNKSSGSLLIQELQGQEAIIEYFEPGDAEFEGELVIGGVGQAYKNLFEDLPDSSFISVNCPIGDDWQLEKHAVVKYTSRQGTSIISCSGALINNTKEDGAPYLLTANHCVSTASDAENMVAYFNFETADCQNSTTLTPKTISEATLLATNNTFDFTLVRLNTAPPASYQPYYAGWSKEGIESPGGVSIHHPLGNEKSISIEYDTIKTYPYDFYTIDSEENIISHILANTTWKVYFDRGLSTNGSSGSPLFDNNNRIIGDLSAGSKTDLREHYFIRFDKAWEPTDSDSTSALKYWLDPEELDPSVLDGYIPYPGTTPPDAHFSSELRGICLGSEIQLNDMTVFGANSWQWEFSPSTVTFIDGNSNSQNPVVKFNETGDYTVSLTSQNSAGTNTHTRNAYINTEGPSIKTRKIISYSTCVSEFEEAQILATGANSYEWFLDDLAAEYLGLEDINNDTTIVSLITAINPVSDSKTSTDSTITLKIFVNGSVDSCSTTGEYDIELVFHNNDNITNAFPLSIDSLQGPFDNTCATIEENEPIPTVGNCVTQGEWCGCELGDDYEFILGNSTWFTFIAPSSGVVGIFTSGYDNQIAVYDADSPEDILSGNPSNYSIIGANDDYSNSDFSAKIPNLTVTPGKKYWIQADGSACNATGEFKIKITSDGVVGISENKIPSQDVANIYPNPANDFLTVQKKNTSNSINIKIFNLSGKLIYTNQVSTNSIDIDTRSFSRGFYIIQVSDGDTLQVNKLVLE